METTELNEYERKLDEAWKAGFEAGVAYTFGHITQDKFSRKEILKFASWIELKCPWLDFSEWYNLIVESYIRMTEDKYKKCKQQYVESKEKYRDNPGMLKILTEKDQELDKEWEQIKASGIFEFDEETTE